MESYTPTLSVQWHITTNCGNRCRHCYMFDDATYEEERQNTLSYNDLLKVLDSIGEFETKRGCRFPSFSLTGGDPLLREDWPDLVRELGLRKKHVSMMGNPETLNTQSVKIMADTGVKSFQMSLDGMEEVHDYFRSPGSFRRVIDRLKLLKDHNIRTCIMFTLFPRNQDQLIPLMRFLADNGQPEIFAFDLGCSVGEGAELESNFTPEDIMRIFKEYITEKKRLARLGCQIKFMEKPNLMHLIHYEDQNFYPLTGTQFPVIEGCLAGWSSISILSDGSVMPCRRLPLKAGKMPEQPFEDIFLGSELMRKFRRREYFKGCDNCDFYSHCRGCPAYTYGATQDPLGKIPLCFRKSLPNITKNHRKEVKTSPAMGISNDEEFNLFKSKFFLDISYLAEKIKHDQGFQFVIMRLNSELAEVADFLRNPRSYLNELGVSLDDYAMVFLKIHFERIRDQGISVDGMPEQAEREAFSRLVAPYFLRGLFK